MRQAVARSVVAGNRLLAALPDDEYATLGLKLQPVNLDARTYLFHTEAASSDVYFPCSAVVCMMTSMRDGRSVKTATVGREGMVGVHVALGAPAPLANALVAVGGEAVRVGADAFTRALRGSDALRRIVNRYLHAFMTEVAQNGACNGLHNIQERTCSWLLAVHDRVGSRSFPLTQELTAMVLGARRTGIVQIAQKLQAARLITYRNGIVTIENRGGLEEAACECYRITAEPFTDSTR